MTTKVVKGSIWTLAGQVAPMAVSFFTTPLIIRKLGPEGYGILILIWSIPTYLGFVDLGMNTASTKFAAEAYAMNDRDREARTIWTAAAIAMCVSLPFACAVFIFSDELLGFLNIPETSREDAGLAAKLTAALLEVTILNLIFNTPQFVRLRMDISSIITGGFRILGLLASAIAILYYGRLAYAALAILIVATAQLVVQLLVSKRLIAQIFPVRFSLAAVHPLTNFGISLAVAGIAGLALVNLDKLVLARMASVESVAYYSVAFIFASLAILASSAVTQSLIPAFSQLLSPEKSTQMSALFERSFRLNVLGAFPLIVGLFVIGKPLIEFWAGEDFGAKSTTPLHILLVGVFFVLLGCIPYSLLLASGQTSTIAKLFWAELLPFLILLVLLTSWLGLVGTAIAWALRAAMDALIMCLLANTLLGIGFKEIKKKAGSLVFVALTMLPPILVTLILKEQPIVNGAVYAISLAVYLVIVLTFVIAKDELLFIKRLFVQIK